MVRTRARRNRVEHLEIDGVAIDFVVLGDGHGGLRGAALADQENRFDSLRDRLVGKGLNLFVWKRGLLARSAQPMKWAAQSHADSSKL